MAVLLFITQQQKNLNFFLFFVITFIAGFCVELIGANTAALFGNYNYGEALGPKFFGVPVVIGINWFIIIYCAGVATQFYEDRILRSIKEKGLTITARMQLISFITDAALLAVFFDWLIEPVAVKLGYWRWEKESVPVYNYICWLIISALLLWFFRKLKFNRHNIFAVHLLIIQLLFFFVLRTFL
jgi:putative membrane protein